MPKRRILTTLLNFDIAVLAFIAIDLILGIPLGIKQILMSLIGRMDVGNSNWYIFVILLCYVIAYIGLKYFHKTKTVLLGSILFPSILVFIFLYSRTPDEPWWYNTIFCFWAGFTYSVYKDIIEKVIKKNYTLAVSSTIVFLILISMFLNTNRGVKDNLFFMVFAFLIVLVTMKINFRSKPLHWMGKRLFPLYIYQRIPMIVLYEFDKGILVSSHPTIYIILCASITFLFGYYYHLWQVKIT
jgi:membrane-bound acyltransferase YfiQ involved in biofilm formation